jgi:hypothetical protein
VIGLSAPNRRHQSANYSPLHTRSPEVGHPRWGGRIRCGDRAAAGRSLKLSHDKVHSSIALSRHLAEYSPSLPSIIFRLAVFRATKTQTMLVRNNCTGRRSTAGVGTNSDSEGSGAGSLRASY